MTKLRTLRLGVAALAVSLVGVAVSAPAPAATYDLAGLWLFNEGAGQTAQDLSFRGNTGQLGSTAGVDANDPSLGRPAQAAVPQALRAALRRRRLRLGPQLAGPRSRTA